MHEMLLLLVLTIASGAFCQTSEDGRSCLGNTVHNYFYGPEGQTINPTPLVVSQQQGKPGKVGPRGDRGFRGQKGTKVVIFYCPLPYYLMYNLTLASSIA